MEKQAGAAGAADGAGPNRKPWNAVTCGPTAGETVESPSGSHVEWCKQLIAATHLQPISGSVPPDIVNRDNKALRRPDFMVRHQQTSRP
ncbi:hypothetical protein INR49_020371 [Caranx melampygus]|nr:hypothetical protein INR49_020371 [Caranx melampygus]